MSEDEPLEIETLNPAGAKVGEGVRIELDSTSTLNAYGLAYGVPLLGLIAGAVIGALLSRYMPRLETLFVAGMCIIGTGAGLFIAVRKGRHFKATPVITEIFAGGDVMQKGHCDKI